MLEIGSVIDGRYKILNEVGRGGNECCISGHE